MNTGILLGVSLTLGRIKWGLLGSCLTLWRIKWGLLTGDDGVGFSYCRTPTEESFRQL